jgi:survival of motor neuron protein-interacting protein 1
MSTPCLPVPKKSKKRKANWKASSRKQGWIDNDYAGVDDDNDDQNNCDSVISFDDETMDASEYLSRVSQQAKNMPDIFTDKSTTNQSSTKNIKQTQDCKIVPIDGCAASISYMLKRSTLTPPPSVYHLPSTDNIPEWTKTVISNFERLRYYLERCKEQGIGGKQTDRLPLPPMKDRPSWHIFCVGIDEANGNIDAYYGEEEEEEEDDDECKDNNNNNWNQQSNTGCEGEKVNDTDTDDIPLWKRNLPDGGHPPNVRLLLQMDQVMIRRILSHLTHFVHLGWSVGTGRRSEWIYALLARLEKPIHRDDASVLFGLLKDLTLVRSKINDFEDETSFACLAKLNVLITLVGLYFEQANGINAILTCPSRP